MSPFCNQTCVRKLARIDHKWQQVVAAGFAAVATAGLSRRGARKIAHFQPTSYKL